MKDDCAITDRADLVQLRNPVAVLVNADVCLDVVNLVRAFVSALRNAEKRLVCRVACERLHVHLEAARACVLLDDITRVAHRHQLGHRRELAPADDESLVDCRSLVVD